MGVGLAHRDGAASLLGAQPLPLPSFFRQTMEGQSPRRVLGEDDCLRATASRHSHSWLVFPSAPQKTGNVLSVPCGVWEGRYT